MLMKKFRMLTVFIILFGCQAKINDLTYTNPIIDKYLADPFIIIEDGYYYLFATGGAEDGRYIPIHRSKDLKNWEFVRGAVSRGDTADWNYKHFWAPEVYKIDDKYYLYYTASPKYSPKNSGNHVGLAVSDKVEGPYQDMGRVVQHSSIDGHMFTDKDGNRYFFYTIEHLNKDGLTAGQIYMDKMISPTQPLQNRSSNDLLPITFYKPIFCASYNTARPNRPFYAHTAPKTWFTPLKEWVTHEAWVKDTGEMTMINHKQGVMLVRPDGVARMMSKGNYWHAAARPDDSSFWMTKKDACG